MTFGKPLKQVLMECKSLTRPSGRGSLSCRFRWVEIWLSILFPPNPQSQIVESDDARNLIDQIARSESLYQESSHSKLTVAYRQLWEVNSRVRHKVLQPRLFHLVLCAFNDLTLNQLTEALRIDPEGKEPYRTELQPKHIEWLCHNFLVITSTARLKWAHQSAEDFVKHHMMEGNTPVFSEASNHFCMSQIALQLISQINHPAWKDGGFDLLFWRQHESYEGQIAAWESEFPRMLEMILDVTNRVITQGSIADLNSFVEQAMLDYMHSSENIQTLAPVLEPTFFVSYVTTRFIVHLRMVCDLTASTSGLEKLLHTIIASTDSALPAIVRLLMVFPVISEKFNYFNTLSKREDKVGRNARYEMGQFFDSRRKRSSFSYYGLLGLFFHYRPMRYRSFAELKEELCTDHDVNAVIDPLKLLTVINTPDKGLIEHAVMISKSTMRAVDWINYPAKLMFLACLYNSDKTVALFLNHAFFPATRYPSSRTLLRAKGKCGELPVHFAAMYGHDRVFEVLVDSEKRRVRSFLKEKGASGEDEIATRDDDIRLLYMVDDEGKLPIHLAAACFFNIPGSERTMNLMMKYDAKYATLFPATLLHQSGAPESAVKQTSMLLMPDHSGQLPIHIASAKNAHGVRAMLQREFEAVRDHLSSDWPSSSSRNHRQRSRLLFSHSLNRKLPIDIRLGSFMQGRRDNQNWIIIQTMLEFEGKWMDLMPTETPGRKRRSELLNPKVFARIVNLWMQAHFEPEWLAWLLDRYELYSSGDLIISLIETRTLMDPLMAATATFNLRRKLLLLLKEDDSQLRLLEQLPFEPNQPSTSTLPPRTFGG